jgi:hypothetical protein
VIAPILATVLLTSAPIPKTDTLPRLVLRQQGPVDPSASLLRGDRPANSPSLKHEVGSWLRWRDIGGDFFRTPSCHGRDGSCDNSGDYAILAGIVGFFIGFGIGHLITGNVTGFVIWLLIDLIVVGVFFIAFPASAFANWYWVSLVALLIDRTVEAFSAAASATRDHIAEAALPPERDVLTGGSPPQYARMLVLHY